MVTTSNSSRSGFVALIGRPNVGKSTLLNALVGEKLSIVSAKPHTTRHRVLGVLNQSAAQAVFIDTPGHTRRSTRVLHRLMARACQQAIDDADLIVLVVDARGITAEDEQIIELLTEQENRTLLAINKIDRLKDRSKLLPLLEELSSRAFLELVPISARRGDNLKALSAAIIANLPEQEFLYPPDFKTDKDIRFRASEIIREKLFNQLHEEVPYGLTVEIESMEWSDNGQWVMHALIWIEKESHKHIVIGKSGQVLKSIGRDARLELVDLLGERVHIELWVKVREHWSDNERELHRLGFGSQ